VVDAVRAGRFRIFAVSTIDEGIEILTARRAGKRTRSGSWPADTVNRLVQDRLLDLAHKRRSFGRRSSDADDGKKNLRAAAADNERGA